MQVIRVKMLATTYDVIVSFVCVFLARSFSILSINVTIHGQFQFVAFFCQTKRMIDDKMKTHFIRNSCVFFHSFDKISLYVLLS